MKKRNSNKQTKVMLFAFNISQTRNNWKEKHPNILNQFGRPKTSRQKMKKKQAATKITFVTHSVRADRTSTAIYSNGGGAGWTREKFQIALKHMQEKLACAQTAPATTTAMTL